MRAPFTVRFLFIALAGVSLLLGLWAGVVRLGFALPLPNPEFVALHGPLMVIGFLTSLIGLERAVAVDARWVFLIPLCGALSYLALLLGWPPYFAMVLAVVAAAALTIFFYRLFRLQAEEHFIVMKASAAVLLCGNVLWLGGLPIHQVVPWWAGFLIIMIAGERLELTRVRRPPPRVRWLFRAALLGFAAGLALALFEFRLGVRLAGGGLIALALWLLRYDLAWQNLQLPGRSRFMAACLIAGYFWLGLGGVFWIWFARFFGAGPLYDAMLHTVFVGFVFSMIFAHGPIILPAITGLALPFRNAFYLHAVLLHLSLLWRIAGDLALVPAGQKWGGIVNAAAILLFLLNNVLAVRAARLS